METWQIALICTSAGFALAMLLEIYRQLFQRRLERRPGTRLPMDRKRLQHLFTEQVVSGIKAGPAFHYAVGDLSHEISRQVSEGWALEHALASAGINGELAPRIHSRREAVGSLATAFRLVIGGGGGITGVPTAECLHRHLPPEREPTKEEVESAWRACQNE